MNDLLNAVIGGLIGAIVPVTLGGIAFAVTWGQLRQQVTTHAEEINRLREWRGKHTEWHGEQVNHQPVRD